MIIPQRSSLTLLLLSILTSLSFAASLTVEPQPNGAATCSQIPIVVQMTAEEGIRAIFGSLALFPARLLQLADHTNTTAFSPSTSQLTTQSFYRLIEPQSEDVWQQFLANLSSPSSALGLVEGEAGGAGELQQPATANVQMLWPINATDSRIPDDEYALLFRLYDGSPGSAFRGARPRLGVKSRDVNAGSVLGKRRRPVTAYYAQAVSSNSVRLKGCDNASSPFSGSSSALDSGGGSSTNGKLSQGGLAAALSVPLILFLLALLGLIASPCVWRKRWALAASFIGLFSKKRARDLRWRDDWVQYSDSSRSRKREWKIRGRGQESMATDSLRPNGIDDDAYTPAPTRPLRATLRSRSLVCSGDRNKAREREPVEALPLYALPYSGLGTVHQHEQGSPGAIEDQFESESGIDDEGDTDSIALLLPTPPASAAVRFDSPMPSAEPPRYEELVRSPESFSAARSV